MKRRIIAALMALCLCIGLLPATALAVEGEATDYISLSDDSSGSSNVGEKPGTVTVVVIDATNNQELGKTTFTRNCTANSLTISLVDGIKDEYDIESVDTNGSYSDNLSADSYSIESWSSPYGEGGLFTVYLCPEFEAPYLPDGEIENLNLTRTYRIYPTQVLKMLRALNADISPDTQIVDIKPIWVKSFAEDDKSFSDVNVESDYGSLIVTSSDGNVDTVQPTNLRKLEITYNNGGDNKTVEVYSKDLRCTIEGTISQYYNIEWNDDSFHIVYFYNETDGNAGNHYFPYAIRFVDDGETLGDQMPPDPVYDNSLYEFVNWEEGGFDGSGNIFNENTPVNDDLTVFARKISTEHAGTIIQVSNENNQLFDRVAELYNVSSDTKLSGNDIIKDSVKIRVNGIGEEHTNETYFSNRWLDITKPGWYEVANNSAPGQDGLPTTNEHVPFDNIREIVVYFEANGIEGQQSVTIPVGSDAGSISKLLTATEVTVELDVNSKPNRPTESDLENPKGILGENAVTVDCTSETADHADKTYGLKDGYTIGDVEWRGTGDAAAYYVDITVTDDPYVVAYNNDDGVDVTHRITGEDTKTITLKWVGGEWSVSSATPVTFTVTCEEDDPTEPDFDADDLAGVEVEVLCLEKRGEHKYKTALNDSTLSNTYTTDIKANTGTVGGVQYSWECTVTINKDPFVTLFNQKAALNGWGDHKFKEITSGKLTFYYSTAEEEWVGFGGQTVTIFMTEQKSQYTLTYDFNGGIYPQQDGTLLKKNSVTLAPGEYTLDEVAGYLEPVPNFYGQGEKVLFAGWTTEVPEEAGKVYHYDDPNIPEIEETVTITDQPVTVYAVWSYDENDDEEADINQIVVKPADITIYMGGTGYEGTVDANGNTITSTAGAGLPEPGFIVTLPSGAPANTVITNLVFKEADGDRTWRFETYDGREDTVVYKLVPQGDEQTATRVQFTKADGTVIVSDEFTVGLEVNTSFTMALYKGSGATAVGKIVADIGGKSYSVNSDPTGTLTVRGTTDDAQYAGMTAEETRSLPEKGKPAVMAPRGTTYAINGGDVQVADTDGVALLFDAVIDHADENRTELLQNRAEAYFADGDVEPETGNKFAYEFKYLDLVDQNNGNVWVAAQDADGKGRDVTVYWPLPEGTNADTNFTLLHFKGLHREMATGDIATEIGKCAVEEIQTEVVGSHVTFKIGSSGFSPFALVYEKDGTTPPVTQYTVTYDANGGRGTMASQTVNAGDSVTIRSNAFTRSNYAFDGWNTRADGRGTSYGPGDSLTVNGNITLYAQWDYTGGGDYNPKDATLRFNSRGGTEFDDIVRDDPFEYNPYNKIPSRPGYRFTGWYNNSSLDRRYPEDEKISVPMGITTVWAGWEEASVPSMLNGDDHYAYIQGYSDGTVRPNANITRAQVATIFFRLLDEDVRDDNLTTYNTFPDVDQDYWANTAISTMASLGVINGRNSGLFDPDAYITRAEFAAICARFDDSGVDGITTFTDTVGHWAEDEISRAAALGWIQGYADGTFRPNQYITRAQAVTMINRVLCRLPEDTDDLLSGMNTWTDCHEDDWFYLAIQEATNSHDFVAKDRVYESWTDLNRAPDWSRYE